METSGPHLLSQLLYQRNSRQKQQKRTKFKKNKSYHYTNNPNNTKFLRRSKIFITIVNMGSNNFSIADVYTSNRCLKYWRVLALFAVLFRNASLLVAASAVENSVDSIAEAVESVGSVSVGEINDVIQNSTEALELPHVFRHQKHNLHKQPVRRTQFHQQLSGNYSNYNASIINSSGSSGNKYFYFQSQLQPSTSEHFRHPNHRHSLDPVAIWGRRVRPLLRHQHQQHNLQEIKTATEAVATSSPVIDETTKASVNGSSAAQKHKKAQRHFDRDGLYQSPHLWATRGPKIRAGRRFQIIAQTNSQRFSLNLNAGSDNGLFAQEEEMKHTDSNRKENDGSLSITAEGNMDSSSEYDDYSYGDSEDDGIRENGFPNVGDKHDDKHRPAVKRYTNPFNDLRMPPKKRDYPHLYTAGRGRAVKNEGADESKTYDKLSSKSVENSNADFSSEKWHRIEQEHHRKQQEHQRQMLALRARHGSHYTGAHATTAPAAVSAVTEEIKQHRHSDDEETENINSPFYMPGLLTRRKQEELGNLAAVQESRRSHVNKYRQEKALAGEHVKQILSEAACHVPHRRVERIQLDPSKMYMPHCTVLHRCTDETGCCRSERQTCAPKRTKNVDLYFYVRSINEKRGAVERLEFINHTECHCVEKTKEQVEEYFNRPVYGISYDGETLRRATIFNCNCPKLYEIILQEDGFCRCDCSSGNTGCDWLKRGMEHFSMMDRKCISDGHCKPPTCEHGPYIKKYGRCPKREEHFSTSLTAPEMLATNALPASDYH